MKTVYSAPNLALVSIFRSVLEGHGIACRIRNEYLVAGVGDLPPFECWPQLQVGDGDFPEAQRIVAEELADREYPPWRCGSCGEEVDGRLAECWNCGVAREE